MAGHFHNGMEGPGVETRALPGDRFGLNSPRRSRRTSSQSACLRRHFSSVATSGAGGRA